MATWYCTREHVKTALDYKETSRSDWQIDRAIEAVSRDVESLCHRTFAPVQATRYFDWPNAQRARSWRLWLNQHDVISLDSLTSGGVTIPAADYFLEPVNDGPPYNRIEVDLASAAAWSGGDTHQQSIVATGLWGYSNDETAVGALGEALDASETAVDVDAATSAAVGVGSVLRVGEERMTVVGRAQLDTGQTLAVDLAVQMSAATVAVQDGAQFAVGEVLLIDGERMLIVDIAGNNLVVKRGWDGSVLAAHTAGAAVYTPRTLTVQRAALGTTATAHLTATALHRWDPPGPVRDLTEALAMNSVLQKSSGYARTTGSGEGERESSGRGIRDLRTQVYNSHGRKARTRAV
ncbi:hypothetical protein LHJ74_14725 [Streptomyces sp. N2-109]|uniref:Uncharacterized protein n=1 Tax=Streptomyces gossypii TaxID=2883101 RepID=A0ABT2JTR4_9ACTN|nr:hypothetical protein [Streptomyces gossypii]MCT2591146.1 hypothetical protein [Streptomyces gossypii]